MNTRMLLGMLLVWLSSQSQILAGWLTIRNDTPDVLMIHELDSNPRNKPQRLYPGEIARSASLGGPSKMVVVYDIRHPDHPAYRGPIDCTAIENSFSIRRTNTKIDLVPISNNR